MKVLLVNAYYYPEIYGGAEYSVKKLAEALNQAGINCAVFCSSTVDKNEIVDGVQVFRRKTYKINRCPDMKNHNIVMKLINKKQELWCPQNKKIIEDIIRDFQPDVIHTNNLYEISPVMWKVAKKHNIKLVHTVRDYTLLCPKASLNCKFAQDSCDKPLIPCSMYRWLNKRNTKYPDYITAPSEITLQTVINEGLFKRAKSEVVENAIDFDLDKVNKILMNRKESIKESKTIRFVYLGTFDKKKGIHWLLNTFQKINNTNIELFFAGKGELEQTIQDICLQDPRMKYVGFLDENGIDDLLRKSDVLLCTSLWNEPFGRVVLDAYKRAMPVISSDKGALPKLVENNVSGLVVNAGNEEQLKCAMLYYVENKEQMIIHSENAVKKLEKFTLKNQVSKFLKIYNS